MTDRVFHLHHPRDKAVTWSDDQAASNARAMCDLCKQADDSLLARYVELGVVLIQIRAQVPHGGWAHWLESARVDRRRAQRGINLAMAYADGQGQLDTRRLYDALAAHEPDKYPSYEQFAAGRASVRSAEHAAEGKHPNSPRAGRTVRDEPEHVAPVITDADVPRDDDLLLDVGEGADALDGPFDGDADGDDDDDDWASVEGATPNDQMAKAPKGPMKAGTQTVPSAADTAARPRRADVPGQGTLDEAFAEAATGLKEILGLLLDGSLADDEVLDLREAVRRMRERLHAAPAGKAGA